jgi:hypothetical protein
MKAMGKAMTQLAETADFDDKLFEEQSHAQLGVVSVKDARSEPMEWILVRYQDTVVEEPFVIGQSVISAHYVQS